MHNENIKIETENKNCKSSVDEKIKTKLKQNRRQNLTMRAPSLS